MNQKRKLVTWFGNSDLLAMARHLEDPALASYARSKTGKRPESFNGVGHIKSLLDQNRFDEVHILSIWDAEQTKKFNIAYEDKATIHTCEFADEFSFEEVFDFTNDFLEKNIRKEDSLSLFLTPGNPAMVSSLLLLGKTRFPATFFRFSRETRKACEFSISFDIVMDCVNDRIRLPDANLQNYAAYPHPAAVAFQNIVGTSSAIKEAVALASRAAVRDVDVLLYGESGTGKELFARAMHTASSRGKSHQPFVSINCAAIPETLIEAELFGSLPGGYTDSKNKRKGAFERAHGGTLFLDEIGEMSPGGQAKLLRAIQTPVGAKPCIRRIQPVGIKAADEEIEVDVRIIAATNRNLQERISEGAFRDDLLYRIGVVQINLPPLRSRPTDIPAIAERVLDRINSDFEKTEPNYKPKKLRRDAILALCKRSWPGNVRQLEAVLIQAAVFLDSQEISADAIERFSPNSPNPIASHNLLRRGKNEIIDLKQRINEIKIHFIKEAFLETHSQHDAADKLTISQQLVSKVLGAKAQKTSSARRKN